METLLSYGANYGGLNKAIKGFGSSHGNNHQNVYGHKGNQGYNAAQGNVQQAAGHVNKGQKKGHFGNQAAFAKANKNDGTLYGNNNVAFKAAKGAKFGQKGAHSKGHSTKGFRNVHHKVNSNKLDRSNQGIKRMLHKILKNRVFAGRIQQSSTIP